MATIGNKTFQFTMSEVDETSFVDCLSVYSSNFNNGRPEATVELIFVNQVFYN